MSAGKQIVQLRERISEFKAKLIPAVAKHFIPSDSPIQCVLVPGNASAKQMAKELQIAGFDIRAILSPTVPKGKERLRICLHSFNTTKQIDELTTLINKIIPVYGERSIC